MSKLMEQRRKIGCYGNTGVLCLSITTVIGIAVDNDIKGVGAFLSYSCALQASFGLFVIGMMFQFILFLPSCLYCARKKGGAGFHLSVSMHFVSTIAFLCGCMVYGIVVTTRIYWYFWCGVFSCILSFASLLFWFATQMFRRYLKKTYPDDQIVQRQS